ncbi:placenta-expressed transcript 1 protein-like [Rana temporaria]|uniref:placenta-expressed transcript 1 protein-like n=1 Tax=Rana temporaria TaxID=8407 RepID=UPI001AADC9F0|nr:placenta-expressed transcript 1 protein-like [Rana temporaria]
MAHTGVTNLLLFLALVISTILGINCAGDPQCQIINTAGNSTTAFNLTVSPEKLSNNTKYTVRLEGSGNVTVILQALSSSNSVGNWSNVNISCNGSPLFQNPFENATQLQAQWTSPENLTSVNITAHIHNNANSTFIVSRTLNQAIVSPNQTTIAPSINNSTAHTSSLTTAMTPVKTTSASSAVQTSLLTVALFQILGLLIITSK